LCKINLICYIPPLTRGGVGGGLKIGKMLPLPISPKKGGINKES